MANENPTNKVKLDFTDLHQGPSDLLYAGKSTVSNLLLELPISGSLLEKFRSPRTFLLEVFYDKVKQWQWHS